MEEDKLAVHPGVEPRPTSPEALRNLDDNGAFVLLVKPLAYVADSGLQPCSIILCRFRDEYVTWQYGEYDKGCNWGHYFPHTVEGALDACIDFLARD